MELNRLLLEDLEAPRFVTMVLGVLDPGSGRLAWASMGHPKGLLLGAEGEVRATLDSTCRPLGLFRDIGSPLGTPATLGRGESLLLVTDGTARLTVADDGPGIPPADRGRVFDPSFSTKPRGTGLGLAITARIAAEHGGRVTVEENLPRGSRFVLEWPSGCLLYTSPSPRD